MRNLSLAAFLALALCACGGGSTDSTAAGATPPAGGGTTTPPGGGGGGTTTPPPGGSATLAWNANIETDISGYRVYYGNASGNYIQGTAQGINVGKATTFVVSGLTSGQRYFFVVTAYDTSGKIGRASCRERV